MNSHQQKQKEIIDAMAAAVEANELPFTVVEPVEDYGNDPRRCFAGVHLPHQELVNKIQTELQIPLQALEPDFYYYPLTSLHMTIKNVRTTNTPPLFTEDDVVKAKEVFDRVIPRHFAFNVYFYRLLLFPNSLGLMGTTDPELDNIILELDEGLRQAGVPDNKVYMNSQYFFSNMTLARFNQEPSEAFKNKVLELSESLDFGAYRVDSVTLLTGNASLVHRQVGGEWKLKEGRPQHAL